MAGEHHKDLNPNQIKALGLLANGLNTTNVAAAVGVTRKTVYNWRKMPAFREALREAGDELWQDTAAVLKGMSEEALSAISAYFDKAQDGDLEKAYFALRYIRDINRVHATNESIIEERRLNDAIIRMEHGLSTNGHGPAIANKWWEEN